MFLSDDVSDKLPTGIEGLDKILNGGFFKFSINMISGLPGTGKTTLIQQLVFNNADDKNKALYLTTLSEPSLKVLRHLQKFNFFDGSKFGTAVIYADVGDTLREEGLDATKDKVMELIHEHQPSIACIDSFKAISDLAETPQAFRKFGYELTVKMTTAGATVFLVGEYGDEELKKDPIFAIADSIIKLEQRRAGLHAQRYLEVLKMRGGGYLDGIHPFTINSNGLLVYPRLLTPKVHVERKWLDEKVSTGIKELDDMLDGGLTRGTTAMIAGAAGTGKTLLGLHFIARGALNGEPGVLVTFQEHPEQLRAIAMNFGWDLDSLEKKNLLRFVYHSPVEIQPDTHAHLVKKAVKEINARRVVIDSIKDLEIATLDKVRYKDYIYSMISEFKSKGITTLLTNEINELFGQFLLSEHGISFMSDVVILLRYVELEGFVTRAVSIVKARGLPHSTEIREFKIEKNHGIIIGQQLKGLTGILSGQPTHKERTKRNMLGLTPLACYLIERLKNIEPATFEALVNESKIIPQEVEKQISMLLRMKIIKKTTLDGKEVFSVKQF